MYITIVVISALVLVLLGVGMRIVWSVELENRMTEAEIESSRRYQAMLGDRVEQGESLGTVHASDPEKAAQAAELLRACYALSETPVERPPFIKAIIH